MKKILFLNLALLLAPNIVLANTLPVPFTSQAPDGIWSQPWLDACEEASITMVDAFYAGKNIDTAYAKSMIQRIVRLEMKTLGVHRDTNAAQIVGIINSFFPWEARVINNPTLEQIKNEISSSRPVILPVYGRALRNPYFRDGGPNYHALVISGFDDNTKEFIVEEPGTKRGANFRYSYERILSAMHDYLPNGRTRYGQPVAIFTSRKIVDSALLDGDGDGLNKINELRYGSLLWLMDSDGDGMNDGAEVQAGRLPTKANL